MKKDLLFDRTIIMTYCFYLRRIHTQVTQHLHNQEMLHEYAEEISKRKLWKEALDYYKSFFYSD